MDDLIRRQDAIDACIRVRELRAYDEIEEIKALPSAEPKTGKWLPDNNNYYEERFVCSECKGNYKVATCMGKPVWKFCPNCGAKMEANHDNLHY